MLDRTTDTTFSDLGIDQDLTDTLAKDGIVNPFQIQIVAIPDGLAGSDVTGKAQTGSGKTLAFGLPMIQQLGEARPQRPNGLILVPTRELANQVTEVLQPLV
ncbi:MAG: DEAD/DEAH box helicase, partial [Acidimicrobiia bacterium]